MYKDNPFDNRAIFPILGDFVSIDEQCFNRGKLTVSYLKVSINTTGCQKRLFEMSYLAGCQKLLCKMSNIAASLQRQAAKRDCVQCIKGIPYIVRLLGYRFRY